MGAVPNVHHQSDEFHLGGAWLTIWDRMFGTHVDPKDHTEPMQFGTPRGYRPHNGLKAQWLGFRDRFVVARATNSWGERCRVLSGSPGYLLPDVQLTADSSAPCGEQITLRTKTYAAVQFTIASLVPVWLLLLRAQHSLAVQVAVTLWLILSIGTIGMILDNAPRAQTYESLRVLASLVALGCVFFWP